MPGVRELFETEPPPLQRKSRAELMQNVDADYYGYRDEDDGVILELEQEAQFKALYILFEDAGLNESEIESKIKLLIEREECDNVYDELSFSGPKKFIAHINVPSTQEIQDEILKRKKQELLNKYLSNANASEATNDED